MARPPSLSELLSDARLSPGVALHNLALVAIGVRRGSLVTVPAELPDGAELGRQIDEAVYARLGLPSPWGGQGGPVRHIWRARRDRRQRASMSEPAYRLLVVREAYQLVVEGSATYRALLDAAKRLGLRMRDVEVRPTIHEVYFYTDDAFEAELGELLKSRGFLRERAARDLPADAPPARRVYPEEWDAGYLERAGRLLGYPPCCQKAYIDDRLGGLHSPEERAAAQVEVHLAARAAVGASRDPGQQEGQPAIDPRAYFTRDFFPCRPTCPAAQALGQAALDGLADQPEAAARYREALRANLDWVRRLPEVLRQRARQLQPSIETRRNP